jgi:hypothetical protein
VDCESFFPANFAEMDIKSDHQSRSYIDADMTTIKTMSHNDDIEQPLLELVSSTAQGQLPLAVDDVGTRRKCRCCKIACWFTTTWPVINSRESCLEKLNAAEKDIKVLNDRVLILNDRILANEKRNKNCQR